MGISSKDIFLDQQNLWLIDERLCFHTLLTSDKKLNKVKKATIHADVMGSDHCPVSIELAI
jgi:exonuclease III